MTTRMLAAMAPLAAQDGVVNGRVQDAVTLASVRSGLVKATDETGAVRMRTSLDPRGGFHLALPPGLYALTITAIGYRPAQLGNVAIAADESRDLSISLERLQFLEEIVVTPGRRDEAVASAASALSVLDRAAVEQEMAPGGPISAIRDVPGVVMDRKGLIQSTFATRGSTGVNSGALLVFTDYRLASVPSLRFNVPYLIPTSSDDVDRVEVVRGPASAIYGPDADRGVVHFVTSSPLDRQGTVVTASAGGRSLTEASFRHASQFGSRLGLKVSGSWMKGTDWPASDPAEVVARDPDVERAAGEVRLDWQAASDARLVVAGGLADAISVVDLTEVGAIQLRDWTYGYLQTRFERGPFLANLFYNQSDAGSSFQLRNGELIIDDSQTLAAQLHHGITVGDRADVRFGAEVQRVVPKTGGTINGRNESDDAITQLGAYLEANVGISPTVELIAAARLDHNNRLDDLAASPRIGVVFQPTPAHALRLTWNRATSTPVASDLFLDLPVDSVGPYQLRSVGALQPYTFRRDCGGPIGLCMRSPFTPPAAGGRSQFLPADATLFWPVVQAAIGAPLAGIPAPSPAQVGTTLGVLDTQAGAFRPVAPSEVTDIPAAERFFTSTLELGYRGRLGSRLTTSVDLYRTAVSHIGTALEVQTPNVFLEPTTLASYLVGVGMSSSEAAAVAQAAASIPVGVVTPRESPDSADVLLVPRQGEPASFWGADFELGLDLSRTIHVTGSYSWLSSNLFPQAAGLADATLNCPEHKGSLGILFDQPRWGLSVNVVGRAVDGFPVRSGVYQGEVEGYAEADISASWDLPWAPNLTLSMAALNVADRRHREFVGAPEIGRLLLARIRARF